MGEVDDIIRRKDDELKRIKIEMINRESTYNNIFKNNVNVGSMNPLNFKTSFQGKKPGENVPKRKWKNNLIFFAKKKNK